ncbi:hypothetical protein CRENBAI_008110 [Crenichthys baileyi]|uniref:Uncharacterized protein n=1 Tax=Crenichthys baileyi TaxID=28760 RepID=A0AAV9RB01_9TELE
MTPEPLRPDKGRRHMNRDRVLKRPSIDRRGTVHPFTCQRTGPEPMRVKPAGAQSDLHFLLLDQQSFDLPPTGEDPVLPLQAAQQPISREQETKTLLAMNGEKTSAPPPVLLHSFALSAHDPYLGTVGEGWDRDEAVNPELQHHIPEPCPQAKLRSIYLQLHLAIPQEPNTSRDGLSLRSEPEADLFEVRHPPRQPDLLGPVRDPDSDLLRDLGLSAEEEEDVSEQARCCHSSEEVSSNICIWMV